MATLPPGPGPLAALSMLRVDDHTISRFASRYGDPVTLPTVLGPVVTTRDPEGNKAILATDPDAFAPTTVQSFRFILGNSILLQHGAHHRKTRKLLMPPFHGSRVRAYGQLMRDTTLRWTAAWQPGRTFGALETTQAITLDVILGALFSSTSNERKEQFRSGLMTVVGTFTPLVLFEPLRREFFGLGPWTGFVRSFAAFRKLVFDMIAENRARPEPGDDVFSLLVAARDEEGQALSDQEILDELMALVFAGHETTAVALAWALYDIHLQPAVLERLRDELAPLGDDPDLGELSKLPFLDAVCNETLRLHPPIPLYTRRLARDTHLLGHDLPAGTLVGTAACSTHRIASIYPDPERFDPERFVGRTYSPHEYLPWGGGVHRCLGVAFATMEMKVVIATILRRHQLKLHERGLVKLKIRPGTVGPRHGIRMALA